MKPHTELIAEKSRQSIDFAHSHNKPLSSLNDTALYTHSMYSNCSHFAQAATQYNYRFLLCFTRSVLNNTSLLTHIYKAVSSTQSSHHSVKQSNT